MRIREGVRAAGSVLSFAKKDMIVKVCLPDAFGYVNHSASFLPCHSIWHTWCPARRMYRPDGSYSGMLTSSPVAAERVFEGGCHEIPESGRAS